MKRMLLVGVLLAAVAAAAVAAPEGDAPAKPQRQPRANRPARVPLTKVLEKLPETLALTDEQKQKAAPIIADFLKSHKELMGSLKDKLAAARNAVRQAQKAVRAEATDEHKKALADARKAQAEAGKPVRDLRTKLVADLTAILNEEQVKKLKGLMGGGRGRRPGGRGGFILRLLKDVKLTDEQKTKIQAAQADHAKAMQALREGGKRPERGKMREMWQAFLAKVKALLTEEQAKALDAKLAEMRKNRPAGGRNRPKPPAGDAPAEK